MNQPSDPPPELKLDRQRGLHVRWPDGIDHFFDLTTLRKQCPCAACRTQRQTQAKSPRQLLVLPNNFTSSVQVNQAKLVGNYALQIDFSDGHTSGIFSFTYLRKLAEASPPG